MAENMGNTAFLAPSNGAKILIIGGCGGIGRAVVHACVDLGCAVTVLDLAESIDQTSNIDSVAYKSVDLRNSTSIEQVFDDLVAHNSLFDHIVFASGYTRDLLSLAETETDGFDDVLDGNLRGLTIAAKRATQVLERGSMVFLSSAIAQLGAPGYAPYSIAKAGVNALLRVLAAELAPGIRVNGVAPGAVDTPFIRGGLGRSFDADNDNHELRFDKDDYISRIPLGRLAEADDIVGPILFLMSDAARFITGQVLHVNGGGFMRD